MGKMIGLEEVVSRPQPGSLIGRDDELALISDFLDRAASVGDAMLLTGEPGVGKTVLLDAAAERAMACGVQVLRASGVEFEADIPFAGLNQVLGPLAEEFEQLCDPHRAALNIVLGFGGGPAPDRLLVCNATLTLVRKVSKARPLLIVVDDLHWLDQATVSVLGFIARRLAGTAVGFLAASRTDAEGFFERTWLAELELRPLDEVTAGRLMSSRFPLLSAHTRRRLAELMSDQPDRRAWHLGEATIEPDEEVAALLEQAAHAIVQRGDGAGAVAASFVLLNGDGEVATAHRLLLRATLVADPARSPRAALDRLDTEIESLTHMADPAEIVQIAGASTFVDRLPDCRQALLRVARDELDGGAVTSVIYANTLLALEAYQTGQWDEAQRLVQDATELCEARGYRLLRRNADAVRAFLAAGRGEAVLAQALADEVIRWAAPRGVRHLHTRALYACVLAALAQSDFEAAYRHATMISPAGQLASHEPHAPWVMMDLVEAALRTDRAGEAAAHVHAMQEAGVARISSRLALLSGAAAAMIAPDEEAIEEFDRSLAIKDAERWPFDLARVHLLYGERLRRAREMTESRVHLVAALETFRRLGAKTWAERAAKELRAAGQTGPRAAHHDREALTPQELEIAMLAATGLSNKQIGNRLFLSHRTVGAHLYRVFPKLAITSRAALRDALLHQSAE